MKREGLEKPVRDLDLNDEDPRNRVNPPPIHKATGADAPPGFHFYFDLDDNCRRWAKTFEGSKQLRDRSLAFIERQQVYFRGQISEDAFSDPAQKRKANPYAKRGKGRTPSLTASQVHQILLLSKKGLGPTAIAKRFNVLPAVISHIVSGQTYSRITGITYEHRSE